MDCPHLTVSSMTDGKEGQQRWEATMIIRKKMTPTRKRKTNPISNRGGTRMDQDLLTTIMLGRGGTMSTTIMVAITNNNIYETTIQHHLVLAIIETNGRSGGNMGISLNEAMVTHRHHSTGITAGIQMIDCPVAIQLRQVCQAAR